MGRETQEIHTEIIHINGHFPQALDRIGMYKDIFFMRQFCYLFHGLYGSHFVIGQHNRNESGIFLNGGFNTRNGHSAFFTHGYKIMINSKSC